MTLLLSFLACLTVGQSFSALPKITNTASPVHNIKAVKINNSAHYPKVINTKINTDLTHGLKTEFDNLFPADNDEKLSIVRVLSIPNHPYLYLVLTSSWSENNRNNYVIDKNHRLDMWGYNPSITNKPLVFLSQITKGASQNASYFDDIQNSNFNIVKTVSNHVGNETFILTFNFKPITLAAAKNIDSSIYINPLFSIDSKGVFQSVNSGFQISTETNSNLFINSNLNANQKIGDNSWFTSSYLSGGNSKPHIMFWINNKVYNDQNNTSAVNNLGQMVYLTSSNYGSNSTTTLLDKNGDTSWSPLAYSESYLNNHPNAKTMLSTNYGQNPELYNLNSYINPNPDNDSDVQYKMTSRAISSTNSAFSSFIKWHPGRVPENNDDWTQKLVNQNYNGNNILYFYNSHHHPNTTNDPSWGGLYYCFPTHTKEISSMNLALAMGDDSAKSDDNIQLAWDNNPLNTDRIQHNANVSFIATTESKTNKVTKIFQTNINSPDITTPLSQTNQPRLIQTADISNLNIDAANILSLYKEHLTPGATPSTSYFLTRSVEKSGVKSYESDQVIVSNQNKKTKDNIKSSENSIFRVLTTSSNPMVGTIINVKSGSLLVPYYLNYNFAPISDNVSPNFSVSPTVAANFFIINPILIEENKFMSLGCNIVFDSVLVFDYDNLSLFMQYLAKINTPSSISYLNEKIIKPKVQKWISLSTEIKNKYSAFDYKGYRKFTSESSIFSKVASDNDTSGHYLKNSIINIELTSIKDLKDPNLKSVPLNQITVYHSSADEPSQSFYQTAINNALNNSLASEINKLWNTNPAENKELPQLASSKYNSYAAEFSGINSNLNHNYLMSNPYDTDKNDQLSVQFDMNSNYTFDQLINAANTANFVAYVRDNITKINTNHVDAQTLLLNIGKYDPAFKGQTLVTLQDNKLVLNTNVITQKNPPKFNKTSAQSFTSNINHYFKIARHNAFQTYLVLGLAIPIFIIGIISITFGVKYLHRNRARKSELKNKKN